MRMECEAKRRARRRDDERGDPCADSSAVLPGPLRNVPVKVAALVNDTVGTLATARFQDADAAIGVILGTGARGRPPPASHAAPPPLCHLGTDMAAAKPRIFCYVGPRGTSWGLLILK